VDIYYFGIIAGSLTGNGNQLKYQLAGSFRRIVGLDCPRLVLIGLRLVLDGLGWSWVGLDFLPVWFFFRFCLYL
jgi:hypothetical protein